MRDEPVPAAPPPSRAAWWRWAWRPALLLVVMGALYAVAEHTGMRDSLSQDGIRRLAAGAGAAGLLAYLVAFSGGQLIQLPGMLFIVAARVAWGPGLGFLAAYAGAFLSVLVTFTVVRTIGGRPLSRLRWAPARRMLRRLDDRPILTVAILRTFLSVSPPLNYAFAFSSLRFRDHLVGSALGLVIPVAVTVVAAECVLRATNGLF
ncbi:MAG TPA: VTT domain-containing protein [Sandaracinaceae bacterium LLY-WYZ-13_1]|nr:VTT domain-containing protein [Sandaracinaceae bacterium LLY-WYZ-13_1]